MATKNPETPKENELTDFKNEEAALKSEISRNTDPGLNEVDSWISERVKVDAKKPTSSEIKLLKKNDIVEDGKVMMSELIKKHFKMNDSVSSGEEWKELQKKPEYITIVQATLNIMNKPCNITGKYDAQTKISLREFVKERTGKEKVLDSDGYLLFGYKNILANALINPSNKSNPEYTSYSSLSRAKYKFWLENTYWDLDDENGAIRIPKKYYYLGESYRYPEWTQFNEEEVEE